MNIKARQRKKQHGVENAKKDNKKTQTPSMHWQIDWIKKTLYNVTFPNIY